MATEILEKDELTKILKVASNHVQKKQELIRDLDAACGDGDLGITVKRGFNAVKELLKDVEGLSISEVLKKAGLEFNTSAASTCGVLFATAFTKAGAEVKDKSTIELGDLRRMVDAAVKGIKHRGGAEVGDKTILDALVPAAEELSHAVGSNLSLEKGLKKAKEAAKTGAENTMGMEPKTGRAKQLGGKSKEVQDPGATVVYLFLEGLASAI